MPFDKVETQVDFPAQERAVLAFWERTHAFDRLREQNRGKPKWSFLDGPITANNPMGVHHAWGRTYKDAYQRYQAMTGHELRYQNGFDCQGLWVEVEVEKELGLRSKRDIENLVPGDPFASIDRFVQLCKARVDKFAKRQTEQSVRLGYWMDWDRGEDWAKPPDERRSYFTMSEENNYTIWSFLKKCHERGLVYRGYDAMPWCPRCAVGLSQMEMHEGYQMVAHRAVFVRFPLRERPGEYLLVWTTTPWTLTSNVAAAVNPGLTYVKVKHRDEVYYLAKGALTARRKEEEFKRKEWVEGVPKLKSLEQVFKEKGGFEVVGELSGAEMVGWTYDGPFDELEAQQHPAGYPFEIATIACRQKWVRSNDSAKAVHRIIAWEDVGETEGTGIVHIAPGCGKEDFLLGKQEGLPPIAPLDEYGVFLPGFKSFWRKSAIAPETTDQLVESLNGKGLLFAIEKYPHSYPHCWRCKTELLFRLVDEWFIHMSWREKIEDVVLARDEQGRPRVTFLPESINGKAREVDWLRNMSDWMISKKRFWGLALPIWHCGHCGTFEVLGGREELRARALPETWKKFDGHTPHRPWIDVIEIACAQCGAPTRRVPDVGNPWLDAGIVPFSTLRYNTEFHPDDPDRTYWKEWFPADFITESFPGQFRNWFYAILAMSTMMTWGDSGGEYDLPRDEDQPIAPFKVLLGHAQVRDEHGDEMHKSKGNAIPFEGAADESYWLAERALKPGESAEKALKSPLPDLALELKVGEVEKEGKRVPALLAKYPPMGADVLRWMYCRQNPALNINFGPHPANEVRSRFFLKLWNTYAFFCNYARLDGFNPRERAVPVKERPLIDRWILSDLQLLVRKAHEGFRWYNIMTFCAEAERFVDDRLSNWYVRRNRRRFWKGEQGADKLAAYQTLYTVLVTLAKLLAPVVPFLAEEMYQNLVVRGAGQGPESVHLCAYPEAINELVDVSLSMQMEAVLRLVSLGSAARNQVKIKVRQPLAELRILPGDEIEREAVERFAEQIAEELNVKRVTLHEFGNGQLLRSVVKPNLKSLGPKMGSRLKEVQQAIVLADPAVLAQLVSGGQPFSLPGLDKLVMLEPADVVIQTVAEEGWSGIADRTTQLALDARVTEELAREGMAREVVRHVQQARKDAGLQMEDRIVLYLHTDADKLNKAIAAHRDYIASETLVGEWADRPLGEGAYRADVKVDGQPLRIELRKA